MLPALLTCNGAVQIHRTKPGARRTGGRFVIGLGLTLNPAKLACRNSRPDAVNNAT